MQLLWDPHRLVFLDETGLNTKMSRLYGRSSKGSRCYGSVPHGHWNSSTFIGALRYDRIDAPLLIDGAMDGTMFLGYIEQQLLPTLNRGDIVICDNLPAHKVAGVRQAIESVGAYLLYLPAYSPDLNPIEMAFSKLKALLRQIAARTWDELLACLKSALAAFTSKECANYFEHCLYVKC
jgi:transposase